MINIEVLTCRVDLTMRQGEVYTAPPNMKTITMKEHWRWLPQGGMKYLDVSCLIFNANMSHIGTVDYRNQYAPPIIPSHHQFDKINDAAAASLLIGMSAGVPWHACTTPLYLSGLTCLCITSFRGL